VWCPGCGDFAVLNSVHRALAAAGCAPHETILVSGIGCSSRLPGYVETYGIQLAARTRAADRHRRESWPCRA
jgi:pyruvate/2-oxoacid:ferredoxin oxidoreductase beta subunit